MTEIEIKIDTFEKLIPEIHDGMELYAYEKEAIHAALEALREKAENDKLRESGRLLVLPCAIESTVWVSPNNGKSYHTGKIVGMNKKGGHLVFVTDTVTDLVTNPLGRFFYDWFAKVYTREEAEKALEGVSR